MSEHTEPEVVVDEDVVDAEVVEDVVVDEPVVEEPVFETVVVDEVPGVGAGAGVGNAASAPSFNDATTFIGKNAEYYIPQFQKMDATNSMISWNWAAALGNIWWMLYRKMYLYALIAWVANMVLNFLLPVAGLGSWIVTCVLFGLFGNWAYKKKVEEELAAAPLDPAARQAQLASRGGITWVPVIILGVVTLLGFLSLCALGAVLGLAGVFSGAGYY